jgi:hypothetical protein
MYMRGRSIYFASVYAICLLDFETVTTVSHLFGFSILYIISYVFNFILLVF